MQADGSEQAFFTAEPAVKGLLRDGRPFDDLISRRAPS
jgi:hypothetical protein